MKLALPGVNELIRIREDRINTLIIEDAATLYKIVLDINQQLEKKDGKTVLSLNDEILEIYKSIELITDIFHIDLNAKPIITKIIEALSQKALDEFEYERTMQVLSTIQSYVDELIWDMDCEISCSDISIKQLIKAVDLHVVDEIEELPEKIIKYIELITRFQGDKLFIFVNLRSFIGADEFGALAKTLLDHEYKVLFIDNKTYPSVSKEERLTVDVDLCEF